MSEPAWLARVRDERHELEVKRQALAAFIAADDLFATLSYEEQNRLHRQLACMGRYRDVLDERIAAADAAAQEMQT